MQKDIEFIDFRVTKLKKWLNIHRECKTETILGIGQCKDGFRFIVCRDCNEAYFVGKYREYNEKKNVL